MSIHCISSTSFAFCSQVCDRQHVGQRLHDPAAPVRSSSSGQTLQGLECRLQCEEGHHGRHAARPAEQGEETGRSMGCEVAEEVGDTESSIWRSSKTEDTVMKQGDRHPGVCWGLKWPQTVTHVLHLWLSCTFQTRAAQSSRDCDCRMSLWQCLNMEKRLSWVMWVRRVNHVMHVCTCLSVPAVPGQRLAERPVCRCLGAGWGRHRRGHGGLLPDAAWQHGPRAVGRRTEVEPTSSMSFSNQLLGDTVVQLLHCTTQREAGHIVFFCFVVSLSL